MEFFEVLIVGAIIYATIVIWLPVEILQNVF